MLALPLICLLALAFNIQRAEAEPYYYNFKITVAPEFPTTLDEVTVTVSFDLAYTNQEETFGPVSQIGNEFFVDIDIYVPQALLPEIRYTEHTYNLGKLPEGSYSFIARVTVSGYGSGFEQYSKAFTVSSLPPIPEFPIGFIFELTFIPILVYLWQKRKLRTLQ